MTKPSVLDRYDKNIDGIVGRSNDVVSVLNAIDQFRVTTLLGPGGVGKTRLAQEISAELETEFIHIRFIDLAATVTDPAVAHIESGDPENYAAMDAGPSLLIFDNCEYDIERAALLVANLTKETSSVSVLATSRRPLHIGNERIIPVRPLSIPVDGHEIAEMVTYESVQLLVERIRRADPDFDLSTNNAVRVAEICRLSGGLPMVLELAAGLARSQPLASVVEAMSSGQDLATKRRDIHPHQQTVAKSVDWSIALLGDPARLALQCGATFRGSFTFEAIDVLYQSLGGESTADPIDELVENSLIQFSSHDNRYRLLETVASVVRNLCTAELTNTLQTAHLHWCEKRSRQIEKRMYAPDPEQTFVEFRLELADLHWAASHLTEEPSRWLDLIGPIAPWWVNHGGPVDLEVWKTMYEQAPVSPAAVNTALGIAVRLGHGGKLKEMAHYGERAMVDAGRLGRSDLQVPASWVVGNAHYNLGDRAKAVSIYKQALELYQKAAKHETVNPSPYLLGLIRVGLAEALESADAKREQLWLVVEMSRLAYPALHISATQILARLDLQGGNFEEAAKVLKANIETAVEIGFDEAAGTSHNIAGTAARLIGNGEAEQHYRSGIQFGLEVGHSGVIAEGLVGLAELCFEAEHLDHAVALARSAQAMNPELRCSNELAAALDKAPIRRSTSDVSDLIGQLPRPILTPSEPQRQMSQANLTDREMSVLRLLRGDLTQREIADELYISASTVRTHVKSIYKKLDVHNRSGCIYEATVRGLLTSPG